jgi:hypothetical protein
VPFLGAGVAQGEQAAREVEDRVELADARVSFSTAERSAWIRRAKKYLHAGTIDRLLRMIDALAVGRRANAIGKHRDYFVRNAAPMQYAAFVASSVPIGSSAIESAVRRVVNVRMKCNGMLSRMPRETWPLFWTAPSWLT